jgi:NAD(P)H-hydrate epimerase
MRAVETSAQEELGIPSIIMMENAAIKTLAHCLDYLKDKPGAKALIIAGPGANGGDGLALARHLSLSGVDTSVKFVGDISTVRGDALLNLEIARKLGISIETTQKSDNITDVPYDIQSCDLIVDALFGTGLSRKVEGSFEYIIDMVNTYAKHVISIDIPSGINADTGQVLGIAVKADLTVTMAYPKIGLLLHPGAAYAGRIAVADISVPESLLATAEPQASIFTDIEIPGLLPKRKERSNKGSFGRIYGFAGSAAMPGAASLSASAAYKAGAGYVCACVIPQTAPILHSTLREAVTRILPEKGGSFCRKSLDAISDELAKASVVYIGPGLGRSPLLTEFVFDVITSVKCPIVIDADALNAITENVDILRMIVPPCIITPHPGEMSRLTGLPVEDILDDTINVATEFAREYEVITLLKDARTIVASPTGHAYINTTGSSALAKAGTGDVLTGVVASFIAQGLDVYTAGMLAAYVHGKAGELAAAELSNYGVLATDVLRYIPKVLDGFAKMDASESQGSRLRLNEVMLF